MTTENGRALTALSEHLRRQRAAVLSRLDEMQDLVTAIDQALEKEMSGIRLTREEQIELFGDGFSDDYAEEAEQRWGETDAWKQSQRWTSKYTKQDWAEVKAEMDATNAAFASAVADGEPATSERAMDTAEQHRLHIHNLLRHSPAVSPQSGRHVHRGPAVHEELRGHRPGAGAVRPRRDPRKR